MSRLSPTARRMPVLALGGVGLVAGVLGGLVRAGVSVEAPAVAMMSHGMLLVTSFFGVVISVERAVALRRWWAWLAPVSCGVGGIVALSGAAAAGAWLGVAGSCVYALASLAVLRKQVVLPAGGMLAAALAWVFGNVGWAVGWSVPQVLPAWMGFLALTVVSERLELSRLMSPPRGAVAVLLGAALAALVACVVAPVSLVVSQRLLGGALVVMGAWLLRWDIATRTVRRPGLPRFVALALLTGYGWLVVGGLVFAAAAPLVAGLVYDAAVHAVMLGFVFSMVFGHAPIVFPAVVKRKIPFTPVFYGHLVLLHAALLLRVAGALLGSGELRALGSAGIGVAIALFVVVTVVAAVRG